MLPRLLCTERGYEDRKVTLLQKLQRNDRWNASSAVRCQNKCAGATILSPPYGEADPPTSRTRRTRKVERVLRGALPKHMRLRDYSIIVLRRGRSTYLSNTANAQGGTRPPRRVAKTNALARLFYHRPTERPIHLPPKHLERATWNASSAARCQNKCAGATILSSSYGEADPPTPQTPRTRNVERVLRGALPKQMRWRDYSIIVLRRGRSTYPPNTSNAQRGTRPPRRVAKTNALARLFYHRPTERPIHLPPKHVECTRSICDEHQAQRTFGTARRAVPLPLVR